MACYKHDPNELYWERKGDEYWGQRLVPPDEEEEWCTDDSVLISEEKQGGETC